MLTEIEQQEFQVIARKWRPKTFDDVVGQDHIVRTLQNAIKLNRLAHGYLFTGSRGVGKTSTARILARALNCEQGPTITPCGVCEMCLEVSQGSSMDVIEIDGASNRGVEQIRDLRDSVKFVPSSGKYKVYIIDEVHMLTKEAFNALLKTLEEPPSHVVFIFATTEPHRVPQTILSRCQRFDFHRINQFSIGQQLARIAESEGIQVEKKVIDALAQAGDGSMRDAQSMFDQVISFCGSSVTFEKVAQILGVYDKGFFFDFVTYAYERKIAPGLQIIDTVIREGKDVNHFLEGLLNHYRYLLLVSLLEDKTDMLDCTEEELAKYRSQAQSYTRYELEFAVEMVSEAGFKLRYALSKQVVIELLLIRLSRLKSVISIDQALLKLSHIQEELANNPDRPLVLDNHVKQSAVPPVQQAPVQQTPVQDSPFKDSPFDQQTPAPISKSVPEPSVNTPEPKNDLLSDISARPDQEPHAERSSSLFSQIERPVQTHTPSPQMQAQPVVERHVPEPPKAAPVERPAVPKPEQSSFAQQPASIATAVQEPVAQPAQPEQKPLSIDRIKIMWPQLGLQCKNALLKSFLERIEPLEYADSKLKIGAGDSYILSLLKDRAGDLENLIEQVMKMKLRVSFTVHKSDTTKKTYTNTNENIQHQQASVHPHSHTSHDAEERILNDSRVQMLIDKLDARVLSLRKDV